jgi:surface protein
VQDVIAATTKWGDIGDWDTSGVEDFSFAFSVNRDEAGGAVVSGGNPKATTFNSDISGWDVSHVTTMQECFKMAKRLDFNAIRWDVRKVGSTQDMFMNAEAFVGSGLNQWITSSLTNMAGTFLVAKSMAANIGRWDVSKVTTLKSTFQSTSAFTGEDLLFWDTSSVTNMQNTFFGASAVNTNIGNWDVAKVRIFVW